MSRDGWAALPRGATGLSAVCDCGISWSYLLTIFVRENDAYGCDVVTTFDVRKFTADAILFIEIQCKKIDNLMFWNRFQCELGWNTVKYVRITITHVCFIAITLARSLSRCLNTQTICLVFKQLPLDPANVNAWKTYNTYIIGHTAAKISNKTCLIFFLRAETCKCFINRPPL